MAHKKAAGSSRNGRESASKRLGVKLFGGEIAIAGNIIVRQRGTTFHPGENVGMGKDHTIFSKIDGIVSFTTKRLNRKFISVLPIEAMVEEKPVKVVATKAEPKIAKEVKKEKKAKVEKAPVDAKEVKAEPKAKKTATKKVAKKGDDLKKINGIGPAFEKRLNKMGIFTYADMAAITVDKAEALETKYDDAMTSPEEWMDWAKEAKSFMK